MSEGIPAIAPWELVYMYTYRTHDGKLVRRLIWTDSGKLHAVSVTDEKARQLGLDIWPDSRLRHVWGLVEEIITLAVSERLQDDGAILYERQFAGDALPGVGGSPVSVSWGLWTYQRTNPARRIRDAGRLWDD